MDFAEQLKSSVDIVKVAGEYVRLRRMGTTGRYIGLCPFHQEKTPSFNVNQTRQFYKCFGCNAGGDVIKFVMEIEGLTFWAALKLLAERHGIPLPKRSDFSDAETKLRAALTEMHAIAAQVFQNNLRSPQGADARDYLERRGVSREMVEQFGLGYADPSGQTLVRRFGEGGFAQDTLEASGLVRRRQEGGGMYDAFRSRLMFPIHNEAGKPIAFGGRAMRDDDQPKYLNSPETPIYRKTSVLYNLHRAKDTMRRLNRGVLVEGYMDVIGTYAAGVHEVVASCGTALTSPQVKAIHRHADSVVVNFDPDTAGLNAAERAIPIFLDEGMHVKVLTLDGGLDPDEYVKQFGEEAYRAKLGAASGYFHWLADRARTKFDMRTPEGRADAFKSLLPTVQKVSDKVERAMIADDLAAYLGLERGLVLDQLKRAMTDRRAPSTIEGRARSQPSPIPALERILLNALLGSDRARREILPLLSPQITEGFATKEIFEALRRTTEMREGPGEFSAGAFSALESRLTGKAQTLLHELLVADETNDEEINAEETHWQQAQACMRTLEGSMRKRQMDELRARVKTAEREGRVGEALDCMAKLQAMEAAQRGAVVER
jgi:DNA primase